MAKKDRSKSERKVLVLRNTIIGFITVIAILIFGFGTYVSTGLSDDGISVSEDFRRVDDPAPRRPGEPVQVVEYFAYNCIHCKNFDPVIVDWARDQEDDVVFSRAPAMWSPIQTLLGQTYLTLEEAGVLEDNHDRIFRAIHDARRQFLTAEMFADYVDGRGISAEEFLRLFKSPKVREAVRRAEADQLAFGINATPSLVVGGEYVVGMTGGQKHALEVVDFLISHIRAGTDPLAPPAPAES